jgi:hypothetical protein
MPTSRRTPAAAAFLLASALCLGAALAAPAPAEKKGILVEVLTQENATVRFELQEVLPSRHDPAALRFTKQVAPTLDQILWFRLGLNAEESGRMREIRIADEPLKRKFPTVEEEILFYPVVLVPIGANTSSWYWQADRLVGAAHTAGAAPHPVSIPLSDVKVVRFVKEP